ncbi:MAG: hypothetical protein AVDCRST_MAG19-2777 [uncultured Thermomicrobiales bacterium]|uniref:Uncharacterized protein n=1 Tax=uncultured Thermomicrobiales bacterium TaxID=1645740 RepID=A0A6J4VDH5_9BACT|nr:MAG: hypothetical protein AVDCRST_MAG19-2777 [uncultured Thermomicrobiales bacterium]
MRQQRGIAGLRVDVLGPVGSLVLGALGGATPCGSVAPPGRSRTPPPYTGIWNGEEMAPFRPRQRRGATRCGSGDPSDCRSRDRFVVLTRCAIDGDGKRR